MHSSSFVPSICRALVVLVLVAGPEIFGKPKDKPKVIKEDLIVTGDAAIDGDMAVTGDFDVAGDSSTLGSHADTYGLGTFYMDSGVDGVRWRLNREAGWIWEAEFAGTGKAVMRLDSTSGLTLYEEGTAAVLLDPVSRRLILGDVVLSEGTTGALQVNATLLASNVSGSNTGDQTRADLQLGENDQVQFAGLAITGQEAADPVLQIGSSSLTGPGFSILGDGTHAWRSGAGEQVNLYLDPAGTLRTDAPLAIDSLLDSHDPSTGALSVYGGLGVGKTLRVGESMVAAQVQAPVVLIPNASGTRMASLSVAESDGLVIATGDSLDGAVEQLKITGDGNLGVGVSDPVYRLDVAGELRVAGTGQSVFKGPVLLIPQGDLPMGEFTEGLDPRDL